MTSPSFLKLASVQATTKGPATISGGKRGSPVAKIATAFYCTPLDPVTSEPVLANIIDSPQDVLQTSCDGTLDIEEGDILVVDSVEYDIKGVEPWLFRGQVMNRLFVIERKQQA
jgi:hypothetical protein